VGVSTNGARPATRGESVYADGMLSRARLGASLGLTKASSVALVSVGLVMATAGSAAAQDASPAPAARRASASMHGEILDPFEGTPRRAASAIAEIVVEIIDPFEGVPRGSPPRTTSEILDPFRTGRMVISEILDPWSS
jgi:hypothetical protein